MGEGETRGQTFREGYLATQTANTIFCHFCETVFQISCESLSGPPSLQTAAADDDDEFAIQCLPLEQGSWLPNGILNVFRERMMRRTAREAQVAHDRQLPLAMTRWLSDPEEHGPSMPRTSFAALSAPMGAGKSFVAQDVLIDACSRGVALIVTYLVSLVADIVLSLRRKLAQKGDTEFVVAVYTELSYDRLYRNVAGTRAQAWSIPRSRGSLLCALTV